MKLIDCELGLTLLEVEVCFRVDVKAKMRLRFRLVLVDSDVVEDWVVQELQGRRPQVRIELEHLVE